MARTNNPNYRKTTSTPIQPIKRIDYTGILLNELRKLSSGQRLKSKYDIYSLRSILALDSEQFYFQDFEANPARFYKIAEPLFGKPKIERLS